MNCLTEACSTPTSPGALVFAVMSSSLQRARVRGRKNKHEMRNVFCIEQIVCFITLLFCPCPGNIPEEYAAGLVIFFPQKSELTVSK